MLKSLLDSKHKLFYHNPLFTGVLEIWCLFSEAMVFWTCPAPWSPSMSLTRWQSPRVPCVRGHPVFSSRVLMRLLEWLRGGWSPAARSCSISASWPGLPGLLLSWVEDLSVSVQDARLSRRNKGTPYTESLVQRHISALPLPWVCIRQGQVGGC